MSVRLYIILSNCSTLNNKISEPELFTCIHIHYFQTTFQIKVQQTCTDLMCCYEIETYECRVSSCDLSQY